MSGDQGRILLIDPSVFFAKRLGEALRQLGFEAVHCADAAYALTMVEWNIPVAILCATSCRDSSAYEIPRILHADEKMSHIPVIAIGDGREQALLEAFRAGYVDYVDRKLSPESIASHVLGFLSSHHNGFQPTQMLGRSETALDGRLSLVDLPGVIQMLNHSRQTGALHINAGTLDGIIFFETGEVVHAESGQLAAEEAVVHLVKSCHSEDHGVYKFVPGGAATIRTVHQTAAGMILDALRELDEEERDLVPERGNE